MLRKLALLAALPASLFFACGGDDGDDSATGGTAGETGAGGEGGAGATTSGKGTIVVEVTGLPADVDADATLEGPDGTEIVTSSVTFEEMTVGTYSTFANRVTGDDPIVRTVYDPSIDPVTFRLPSDETETVRIDYQPVPSSNKLWTVNANGDHALVAFDSGALGENGEPDAKVAIDSPAGVDIAFDHGGNLWAMGPTLAEPHLVRLSSAVLGESGAPERDRSIDILDIPCLPALRAMAFDLAGSLWVSTCGDRIVRLTTADLALDGEVSPEVVLGDVIENGNLAFDASGNLWVVTGAGIARYDAARLGASDGEPPDLVLIVTDPDDENPLGATDLVFDLEGNLWVTDFGRNLVYEVASAELDATGEQTVAAAVRVAIGIGALIDRPAFDESGALWIGLGGGGIGRLTPEQLAASTDPGDPTIPEVVITSADLGSVSRIAFYPAAAGLPLLSSLE